MTTVIFVLCIFITVASTMLIACRLCYKNSIPLSLIGTWALGFTGLITHFAGIW